MYCPVKLTTDPDVYHVVKLTVKELKSGYEATIAGIYRGYDAKVEQTRKKASDVHRTPQRSDTSNTSGTFLVSIGEMLDQVKDNDGDLYFQPVRNDTSPVRESLTRKPDSAQAKVVHLPEKAVLQFPKIQDFNKWVKALLMNDGNPPVIILSTGQEATFTGTNIKASLKRARSEAHREAYAALRQMISLAEYDHFEPADVKHPYVQGQDVYYSALSVGDRLYSVRLKLDVPPPDTRTAEVWCIRTTGLRK